MWFVGCGGDAGEGREVVSTRGVGQRGGGLEGVCVFGSGAVRVGWR